MRTSIINLHGVTPMTSQQASELKGGCGGTRRYSGSCTTYTTTRCGSYTPPSTGCGTTTPPTPTNTGSANVQAGA